MARIRSVTSEITFWKEKEEEESTAVKQWLSLYTVSQKNCAKLFLSELRQISTNFDNF